MAEGYHEGLFAPGLGTWLVKEVRPMLAQYGGGGGSGGGVSYGPVFWIVFALVVAVVVSLIAWYVARRRRTRSGSATSPAGSEHTDRAA
jgi:hypothetical protein